MKGVERAAWPARHHLRSPSGHPWLSLPGTPDGQGERGRGAGALRVVTAGVLRADGSPASVPRGPPPGVGPRRPALPRPRALLPPRAAAPRGRASAPRPARLGPAPPRPPARPPLAGPSRGPIGSPSSRPSRLSAGGRAGALRARVVKGVSTSGPPLARARRLPARQPPLRRSAGSRLSGPPAAAVPVGRLVPVGPPLSVGAAARPGGCACRPEDPQRRRRAAPVPPRAPAPLRGDGGRSAVPGPRRRLPRGPGRPPPPLRRRRGRGPLAPLPRAPRAARSPARPGPPRGVGIGSFGPRGSPWRVPGEGAPTSGQTVVHGAAKATYTPESRPASFRPAHSGRLPLDNRITGVTRGGVRLFLRPEAPVSHPPLRPYGRTRPGPEKRRTDG